MGKVIDDHLVIELLVGGANVADGEVLTTYHWWWRLARALHGTADGRLSAVAATLPDGERHALDAVVADLHRYLTIPDPRLLIDLTAQLANDLRLNLLSAEALAVALAHGASLTLRTHNPPLAAAAKRTGVRYQVQG